MKSIRDQQQERRQQKLAEIRRKVKNGSLVIRQMTPEERKPCATGGGTVVPVEGPVGPRARRR
jgi:hypothetical protein